MSIMRIQQAASYSWHKDGSYVGIITELYAILVFLNLKNKDERLLQIIDEYTIAFIVSVWNIVATQINNPKEFVQHVYGNIHDFLF